jgi:hypothetical protein
VAFAAQQEQRGVSTEDLLFLSLEYHFDESGPDVVILRRQEGAFVAAFSARGVTREGIVEAAEEDYREFVRVYLAQRGKATPDVEREEIRADTPQTGTPTRSRA